jgi:hypothetical protein
MINRSAGDEGCVRCFVRLRPRVEAVTPSAHDLLGDVVESLWIILLSGRCRPADSVWAGASVTPFALRIGSSPSPPGATRGMTVYVAVGQR